MERLKDGFISLLHPTGIMGFLVLLVFTGILVSCQKVVNIDLNSSSPQIVIECNITNLPGPYIVRISRTINFNDKNVFPIDSNAIVQISDTLGNVEKLIKTEPGIYSTSTLQGVPGRTYTLSVISNGIEYKATSTMSYPVEIDTLRIVTDNEFRRSRKEIEVTFYDPKDIHNYYRFVTSINGKLRNDYSLLNDRYTDGKKNVRNINVGDSTSLIKGDTVAVMMHSIDKATYDYFRTLRSVRGGAGLGFLSASPANPITNFDNGALGYFSAYSITNKVIIVP